MSSGAVTDVQVVWNPFALPTYLIPEPVLGPLRSVLVTREVVRNPPLQMSYMNPPVHSTRVATANPERIMIPAKKLDPVPTPSGLQ